MEICCVEPTLHLYILFWFIQGQAQAKTPIKTEDKKDDNKDGKEDGRDNQL